MGMDEDHGAKTIQFWKSWPDGATCKMLELSPDEVPSHKSGPFAPWRKLDLPRGGRYTFDIQRDWWVAPADIDAIVLWVGSSEDPKFMWVATRGKPLTIGKKNPLSGES